MNTLTDAIAAYRAAQTVSVEAKRDAYEAILQHMAADTPEDADYESATQDLMEREGLDRVDTPVEPVEEPEPTRFYVAVPASDRGALIAGIGVSESLAIQDAYRQSNSHPPAVSFDETLGHWQVVLDGGDRHRFDDEDEANRFSAGHGFVAQRCTWRLYDHVDRFGAPESWTEDARGYQDVDYDRDDVTSLAQAVFLAKHAETDEERELAHVHLERTLRGVADRAMVFDDVSANREAVDVVILRGSDAVTLGIGASLELTRGSTRQLRYSPERTHRIVEGTLEGSARDAVFELLARDLAGIPASA